MACHMSQDDELIAMRRRCTVLGTQLNKAVEVKKVHEVAAATLLDFARVRLVHTTAHNDVTIARTR